MGLKRACETDTVSSQRIIFSTPFAVISYFLIWFVPDISTGQVMWYLIFYCIFQTLVTVSWALHVGSVGRDRAGWQNLCPGPTNIRSPEPILWCHCSASTCPTRR